jgi:hypothetical protein
MFALDASKLGPLERYNGPTGNVNFNFSFSNGCVVTALFDTIATFQKGKAQVQFNLIRHDKHWEILGFHVNSSVFAN